MSELVRFEDGVTIEVATTVGRSVPVKESAVERISAKFGDVLQGMKPIVESVVGTLNSSPVELAEAEVKLGIGFSSEGGIYVVKSSVDANLEVTLTFRRNCERAE